MYLKQNPLHFTLLGELYRSLGKLLAHMNVVYTKKKICQYELRRFVRLSQVGDVRMEIPVPV